MTTAQSKQVVDRIEDRLLNAVEAARLLSVSTRTIWRLRDQGILKPVRIGSSLVRWKLSDLQRLVRDGDPGVRGRRS